MNWKLCGIGRGLIYDTYFTFIYGSFHCAVSNTD